ncbi:MAG: cyclic nucleotide-binding domain-containing protein [Pseudomonadota bacterium]
MADPISFISEHMFDPAILIFLAIALQSASFLLTGQLKLRLLFMTGTLMSIFYFLIVREDPAWEPVIEDFILGAANLYGLTMLLLDRSPRLIPADQRPLFDKLEGMQPGVFRALMKQGEIRRLECAEVLTTEGEVPDRLFYLLEGDIHVIRDEEVLKLELDDFVGELSLILGTAASATTKAYANAQIVEWDRKKLTRAMERNQMLEMSLRSLMAQNMAKKVARKRVFAEARDDDSLTP